MPFFDQHWQLRWLGAGLTAVAAVLLPLRYLQVAAIWDHLRRLDMRPDIVFASVTAVTLLGIGFLLARSARRARARLQWRIEMLAAGVHPMRHRASSGTVSDHVAPNESAITIQRIGIVDRILGWMFVPIFIVSVLVSMFVLALAAIILINPTAPVFGVDSTPAFVYLLTVPFMAVGLWAEGTLASDAWASPPRFELDQFGITWISPGGKSVTIRWQEARLLEEATIYRPEGRQISRQVYYLLYGNDTVMRIDPKGSHSREVGQLLARIKMHTSLVPRQFDQPGARQRIVRRSQIPHVER